jgi:hypothetical protein
MFSEPVTDTEENSIMRIKLGNGYFEGQADKQSLTGLGAFFWETGEFYFGEWEGGAQTVQFD